MAIKTFRQSRKANSLNSEYNQRARSQGLEILAWNAVLWRYVDLPKFVHMLAYATLPLIRLDQFEDQWEGFSPPLAPHEYQGFLAREHQQSDLERFKQAKQMRKSYYASCWHLSDVESDAMWKLYSSSKQGLAIRTTYRNLIYSLRKDSRQKKLLIGKVRYTKLPPGCSMLQACMTKREPFAHEKEVRVIWHDATEKWDVKEPILPVCCDPKHLIEDIFVSPRSEQWFEDVVRDLVGKYELKASGRSVGRRYLVRHRRRAHIGLVAACGRPVAGIVSGNSNLSGILTAKPPANLFATIHFISLSTAAGG